MAADEDPTRGQGEARKSLGARTVEQRLKRLEDIDLFWAKLIYATTLTVKKYYEDNYGFRPPASNKLIS